MKYKSLFGPFVKKKLQLCFYTFFSLKRFFVVAFTIILINNPLAQSSIALVSSIIFFLYIFFSKPYISQYDNVLSILNEIFTALLYGFSLSFSDENDPEGNFNKGWVVLLLMFIYCGIMFGVVIFANIENAHYEREKQLRISHS
jgi:hypothetical protein